MEGVEIKISSVSEFIDSLKDKFQDLKQADDLFFLWFRGEECANSKTPLAPKAFRCYGGPLEGEEFTQNVYQQAQLIEGNLKGTFSREATPFLLRDGIEKNLWNEYYLMQHYGLRTRLLDWTGNALLALFFAVCEKKSQEEDGRVWILAPHRLNNFTISTICKKNTCKIYTPEKVNEKRTLIDNQSQNLNMDELYRRYLKLDFENCLGEVVNNTYYPLALYPPLLDQRMVMQQSYFTIFGNQVNGLLSASKKNDFLRSIVIDANKKGEIKEELKWMGITYKTAFPDLSGICRTIEDHYNIEDCILKRTS